MGRCNNEIFSLALANILLFLNSVPVFLLQSRSKAHASFNIITKVCLDVFEFSDNETLRLLRMNDKAFPQSSVLINSDEQKKRRCKKEKTYRPTTVKKNRAWMVYTLLLMTNIEIFTHVYIYTALFNIQQCFKILFSYIYLLLVRYFVNRTARLRSYFVQCLRQYYS